MQMKALYLEPDEEITSVVDRLREIDDAEVAIVVPKRAGLLQSIINLKLLRYQGEQLKKRLSIVTTDKTGRNLASAVGLTVYQKLPDGRNVKEAAVKDRSADPVPITFRKRAGKLPIGDDQVPAPRNNVAAKLTRQPVPDQPNPDPTPAVTAVPETAESVADRPDPAAESRVARATAAAKKLRPNRPPLPKLPKLPGVPKLPRLQIGLPKVLQARRLPIILAAVLVVLLLAGTAAAVALPSAEVTVSPKTNPFSAEVPVTFSVKSAAPDLAGHVLPAKAIEVTRDATATVNATGSKDSGAKATGTITVVNTLGKAQSLVARTRFQAPDGRVYRTQSGVTVPAGGQTSVTIAADDGGETGNLAAGTRLGVPGLRGDAVYGQADQAITGGSNSATPQVSDADVDRGKVALAAAAAKEGVDEARPKLAVGNKINDQMVTTDIQSNKVNPPVGAQAPTFTVSGKVKVVYFTYSDTDLQKLVGENLRSKVPAGSDLVADSTRQTFVTGQTSTDRLTGTMQINGGTTQAVSRERIKQQISGKKPAEAAAELKRTGAISDAQVKLSPFWVSSVPKSDKKITIRYSSGPATTASPSPTAGVLTPLPTQPPNI